jgi:hypothetical protein
MKSERKICLFAVFWKWAGERARATAAPVVRDVVVLKGDLPESQIVARRALTSMPRKLPDLEGSRALHSLIS